VHSTIVGVSSAERVVESLQLAEQAIPAELWDELAELTPSPQYWIANSSVPYR
jgi:D-threo-aldose 1-dehydrogenase